MQVEAVMSSTYSYAVFRYVTEPERDISVPIGVGLWRTNGGEPLMRFLAEDETVRGASGSEARQFIAATENQIREWIRTGQLPYDTENTHPCSGAWWEILRSLLEFRIRVSAPMAIDCVDPAAEIEPLYQAVVDAEPQSGHATLRMDGALTRALGQVARRFQPRQTVVGYGGREINVRRLSRGPDHQVVADAVNLASPQHAEDDADALVSKALRIKAGNVPTDFILGYLASPGGLNGEGVLVDWIEEKLGARPFDLIREIPQFQEAADLATASHQMQPPLLSAADIN